MVIHYFWARWGLITVHSKDTPLAKVIHSIEKQGHVTIRTNLDPNKPVFMNVDYVSLNEAMETLATVMDARWRLTYVVGPDKGTVNGALSQFEAGNRDESWKHLYVPLSGFGNPEQNVTLPDPRKDTWAVKPASESTLHAYLEQAARNVSASFWVQENYNPAVKSAPRGGAIGSSLSRLASASNSKYAEVIILQGSNRESADRGPRERGDGEPRFAGNFGERGRYDSSAMDERLQNEINKMTGDQRAAAEAERARRQRLLAEMKDLTPEQRQQRFQDMMNNPENQEKMESQQNNRANRNSPSQRISRGGGYMGRMAAAQSAAGK
jgi:hypothetical protein